MFTKQKYISYLRVSLKKQGKSGLGLKAQQTMVNQFIKNKKGDLINEYVEIETGSARKKRIEIFKALNQCKETGAKLVIAKLDRLTRDGGFWEMIKNSGVECISCDNPEGDELVAETLMFIAKIELANTRKRTSAATKEKIKNGGIIGNPKRLTEKWVREKAIASSIKTRTELAALFNHTVTVDICALRNDAKYTFQKIADHLNKAKHRTVRGNEYTPKQVQLIYNRYCQAV